MIQKIRNIKNLIIIFIKENGDKLNIIKKDKILNKKTPLFWIYIIIFFAIYYFASEIIYILTRTEMPEIFLNGFLLFLELLIIVRTIMVSMNILYFSKDIENILHFPFSNIEIIVAKFTTILFMNYEILIIFGLIPLVIYGLYTNMILIYFFNVILVLILFPIFATLMVSILTIILMKTIKYFKNKDLMQIIISFGLIFVVSLFATKAIEWLSSNADYVNNNQMSFINFINNKIIKINRYFISVNPAILILKNESLYKNILGYLYLTIINLIGCLVFIYLGYKLYLKQVLNAKFYYKNKKSNSKNISKKIKKVNNGISYIKKEFKMIFKNPIFFIQCIYPIVIITIIICVICIVIVPIYRDLLNTEKYREILYKMDFNIETFCFIIGIIQVIGLLNYSSVTCFSREGKNAYLIKNLPIDLYLQYVYKNIPQILINTISLIFITISLHYSIPEIKNYYIMYIFLISFFMNILNSFILSFIDLRRPNFKWDAEYELLRQNKNKMLQFVLIISNILFLNFIQEAFEKTDLDIFINIFLVIIVLIIVIFNLIMNKYKNKLFKKIN